MTVGRLSAKKIAFLGPGGSYSHAAVLEYAAQNGYLAVERECSTFDDVLREVEEGLADCAVLPLENTSSGLICEVYDLLQGTSLQVVNEIHLAIEHCLLVAVSTELEKIKTVYSHPEPFRQCSRIVKHFSHWKIEYTTSTASAMEKVAQLQSPHAAALGGEEGGKRYQLHVLVRGLADKKKNVTRFVVLI